MTGLRQQRYYVTIPKYVSGDVVGRLTALGGDVESITTEQEMLTISVLLPDNVADGFRSWLMTTVRGATTVVVD